MTITYPKAFSTEINDFLSPDEAHERSVHNTLKDRRAFQCGPSCNFSLTLTNFGKEDYVQSPHFTPGKREQVHSKTNCKLMIARREQRNLEPVETNKVFTRSKSNIKVDMDFTKGLLSKILTGTKQISTSPEQSNNQKNPKKSKGNSKNKTKSSTSTVLKSLKKLIEYYHDFKEGDLFTFTDMLDHPLILDEIFTELTPGLNIVDNSPKIYFGLATVYYRDDVPRPYFLLKYKNEISFKNVVGKPSKIINVAEANVYGSINKVNRLKRLAKSKEEFMLYYFGGFKIKLSNEDFYINFDKAFGEEIQYIFIP
ncbi:MAG: hypothetical protein KH106_03490 [Lactococcus lactis]|nr:hypothetical protein [Lactococcus lactis]